MAYLKRKADKYLKDWKTDPARMPLLIKGARQVGKTETIRRFAEANYDSFIEINFVTHPVYKGITGQGFGVGEVTKLISRIDPSKRFIPGKTLLFFDEIQEFPDIATTLKFFKEDGRYDVICSGSLLGVHYKRISSISVGSKTDFQMHSMDFEEFLWAKGYDNAAVDELLDHMVAGKSLNSAEHEVYSTLFTDFCILGGMPAVVARFMETGLFTGTLDIQRQLLLDYEDDARKYAEGLDQARIISAFRAVPAQLAKENKKYQYSLVRKGGRAKDYAGCIEWLKDAGMVVQCKCMQFPELPIRGNLDDEKFKIYFADTGLLVASLDDEAQADVRSGANLGVYKGGLYENIVADALVKQGYELCYYKKDDSTLEMDFFVRSPGELVPIEVKAGRNKGKSLSQLINSEHYPDIQHGIKFSTGNIAWNEPMYTFPHYCVFLLRRFMERQRVFS